MANEISGFNSPPSLPPLFSSLLLICDPLTEAVVHCEYENQEDDELSMKVGDVIADVKEVCT